MSDRRVVAIGGSDAGISAALRIRELDPTTDVTVVVADAFPNFSICGIPYYVSGEVTHWSNLAHRTAADLAATGMRVLTDTTATRINVTEHTLDVLGADGTPQQLAYDALVVGTGAVSARPPIAGLTGPDALGPAEGVHLLHSMGDTFAVMESLHKRDPKSAVIIGAGYIGLEMAEALTTRGIAVTQIEALPEVLPTVDAELGALVHTELERHGVEVIPGGHPAIELLARRNIFGERRCTNRLRVRGVSGSPELELLRIVGRRGPPLDTPDVQKVQPQQQRLRVIAIRCIGHVAHTCGGQERVDSQVREAARVEDKPLTWKCTQP